VVNTTGGLPNQVCSACGVWGFLSGGRRIVVVTSDGQADVVDVATREREPVLRVKGGRVDRVHVSPDERLVSFRSSNRLLVAPFTPGHPPPETSFAPIDDPAATGRPCGWSRDSSSVFLLLDTDGFRCLWSQRIDAATAKPTGAPVAARHFHQTIVQEFSTTFGNAITDEGFVYGATLLKANLWRLVPDASAASRR
jgi:hypothetical protein